jgi:hypothetical protein
MILISILPSYRKGKFQFYEVVYEDDLLEKTLLAREKKILDFFNLDKQEFRRILRESLTG